MFGLELSVVLAWVASWIVQKLKNWEWLTVIAPGAVKANRVLAALLAAAAVVGIHFQYTADTGTLVITGLFATSVITLAIQWAFQFLAQEVVYRNLLKPKPPAVTIVPEDVLSRIGR